MAETNTQATDTGVAASNTVGAATPGQFSVKSASDVFDAAKTHFFDTKEEDLDDEGGLDEEVSSEGGDDVVTSDHLAGDNSDTTSDDASATQGERKPGEFTPYEYKGKVLGKEVAQKFETKADLDKAVARGLAAPKLYESFKKMESRVQELEADAGFATDIRTMAAETPRDLMNLLRDELIPKEVMAEWVFDMFHEYKKIADMSPQERERHERLQLADRIIEEQKYNAQLAEKAKENNAKAQAQREQQQFESWKEREQSLWKSKIPGEHSGALNTAMRAVVAMARAEVDAGRRVTFTWMSRQLETILKPIMHSKSPSQQRRELGKASEDKKNQTTAAVQGTVTRAATQSSKNQPFQPKTAADVFDRVAELVKRGKLNIK